MRAAEGAKQEQRRFGEEFVGLALGDPQAPRNHPLCAHRLGFRRRALSKFPWNHLAQFQLSSVGEPVLLDDVLDVLAEIRPSVRVAGGSWSRQAIRLLLRAAYRHRAGQLMADNPQPFPVDQVHQFASIVVIHAGDARESLNRLDSFRVGGIH